MSDFTTQELLDLKDACFKVGFDYLVDKIEEELVKRGYYEQQR